MDDNKIKYYKLFNAGPGGQDKEALEFKNKNGWNKIWISENTGPFNGDSWIVYRNINDLPSELKEYASQQEKLDKNKELSWDIKEPILAALDGKNSEILEKYISIGILELSNPLKFEAFMKELSECTNDSIENIFIKVVKKDIKEVFEKDIAIERKEKIYEALKKSSIVPIENGDTGVFKALYSPIEHKINICKGRSVDHMIKPLTEEIVQSMLHQELDNYSGRKDFKIHAENIAYAVYNHFGLKTGEFYFTYKHNSNDNAIKNWISGMKSEQLKKELDIIRKVSGRIIEGVELELQESKTHDITIQENQKSHMKRRTISKRH